MDNPQDIVDRLLPYGVVVRAFAKGLRISVRDELDDNVLLDALRAELAGAPAPSAPFDFDALPPRRC